jgi:tRNA-dihydrouridine synthase
VARDAPAGHGQDAQRLERGDARPGRHRAPHAGRRRARVHAARAHAHADVHGHARWEEIAAVVEALDVPVIGNGDIKTADDVVRMRRVTGASGIMIGRGSYGQPWIFDQAKDLMAGRPMRPTPDVAERFAVALDHARMVQAYEADAVGAALEFRKHLGWYAKGLPNSADLRRRLHAVESFGEVEGIFGDYLDRLARGDLVAAADRPAAAAEDDGIAQPARPVLLGRRRRASGAR